MFQTVTARLSKGVVARAAAICLVFAMGNAASAAVFNIAIDAETIDGLGAPGNQVVTIDLATALGGAAGSEVLIDAIGWDLTVETVGASWMSEATLGLGDSAGAALFVSPGAGFDAPGTMLFSTGGLIDLVGLDLEFTLSDGVLVIEFFEGFDDVAGMTDAFLNGSIDISANLTAVPVPAAVWLMGSALLGLVGLRRR
ncbi:MAG: hypothetical protein AAF465_17360 [Pseudomonadota bacterium]